MKPVSAQLVYQSWKDDNCHWGIGVIFGNAPGAQSYIVTYWDGYFKQVTTHSIPAAQVDAGILPQQRKFIPAGKHYVGATGGNGGGADCILEKGDPTEGGRFSKGAKAWGVFAEENRQASLEVVVSAPALIAVDDSARVSVKVSASGDGVTGIALDGLHVAGRAVRVTRAPIGLSGFALSKGASRTFAFTVRGVRPGRVTVNAAATGTGASKRNAVRGSDRATMKVGTTDPQFTYTMPERLPKTGEPDDHTAADFNPAAFTVRFKISANCHRSSHYEWSVDGRPATFSKAARCTYNGRFPKEDTYRVRVTERKAGEVPSEDDPAFTDTVVVQDFLIVAIGDSLASGEGNPPFTDGTGLVHLCDRSNASFAARAAAKLEDADEQSSVTFVHLACTGATVNGYTNNLNRQVRALKSLIGDRQVDALILTGGINDALFGKVIESCIVFAKCQDLSMGTLGGSIKYPRLNLLKDVVRDGVDGVSPGFRSFNTYLKIKIGAIDPSDVYLVGYPDPLHGRTGLCDLLIPGPFGGFSGTSGLGADDGEVYFAEYSIAKPVNEAQQRAARNAGWTWVDMPLSIFGVRGYCTNSGWWVPFGSAAGNLNVAGTLHPSDLGHNAIMQELLKPLKKTLLPGGNARKPR